MKPEDEKYNRILNILKESKPVLRSGEEIEREVVNRILKLLRTGINFSDLIDFLFGWVYIGWVRRSLIAASVALVMLFVYQQGVIMRQINFLNNQIIVTDGETSYDLTDDFEKKLMMYKISGRRLINQRNAVSEKELNQLINYINELQSKYEDLQNLIEEDPELKSYIEKKLKENNRTNI